MKKISIALTLAIALALTACGLPMPEKAQRLQTYDFGITSALTKQDEEIKQSATPIALAPIQAPASLNSSAINYRLAYQDQGAQLMPYSQSRWIMPATQLIAQRIKQTISNERAVLSAQDNIAPIVIQIQLQTFEQIFQTQEQSEGVITILATATSPQKVGQARLISQRTFTSKKPAQTADARGAVSALALATDDISEQITKWAGQITQKNTKTK